MLFHHILISVCYSNTWRIGPHVATNYGISLTQAQQHVILGSFPFGDNCRFNVCPCMPTKCVVLKDLKFHRPEDLVVDRDDKKGVENITLILYEAGTSCYIQQL